MSSAYEYKNKISHWLKLTKRYISEEKWPIFLYDLEQMMADIEEDSFVEGYCYAIQILQDNLKKHI